MVNARVDLESAEAVAEEVRGLGRRALAQVADVADEAAIGRMFEVSERELGGRILADPPGRPPRSGRVH